MKQNKITFNPSKVNSILASALFHGNMGQIIGEFLVGGGSSNFQEKDMKKISVVKYQVKKFFENISS